MKNDILKIKNLLLTDGFIIINDLVSHKHLDLIYNKIIDESWQLMKKRIWGGVGSLHGHLQQNPPRYSPYIFKDILSNPVVIQISNAILGDKFYNDFYSSNTNCPGSIAQPVHSDCTPLWRDNNTTHPPFSLVINIPLIDVNENNGSMEIWPGSHMVLNAKKYLEDAMLDKRRITHPPIRANIQKGSILIRDVRTWHRGMPNNSSHPRHMLAMIHRAYWFQRGERLAFTKGCENEILADEIDHHIYFTDESIDHSVDPTHGAYSIVKNI